MATQPIRFGTATPILRVSDFDRSVAYYVDALGFKVEWQVGKFGSVRRGDTSLMLCEGSQGHAGTWVYIVVSDADALYGEVRERAKVRHPPANFPWGSRELHIFDPDGHVLRFGSEAPEDGPLGEWLDEDGRRWQAHPDGRWSEAGGADANE